MGPSLMLPTFRVARIRKKGAGDTWQETTGKQRRKKAPEMVQALWHRDSHKSLCHSGTMKARVPEKSWEITWPLLQQMGICSLAGKWTKETEIDPSSKSLC